MAATAPTPFPQRATSSRRLEPLRSVDAGVLHISYYEEGPADGPVVVLLHGFPYDIHSYVDVAPQLAAKGCRVIVPYLRGYGPTRFLDPNTPRSGEQAAVGADLIALIDALGVKRAIFAGYDWGGRAACVGAALWPERCAGLVSVNGYLIQERSVHDKRSVRVKLSEKGRKLNEGITRLYKRHEERLVQAGLSDARLNEMNKVLHDLETFWSDQMGAGGLSLLS